MKGSGKHTIVYIPEMQEPELMYKLFDLISGDMEEVLDFLEGNDISRCTASDIYKALIYIGADPNDFPLRNDMFTRPIHDSIHGIGHIYRTMIACALLAERLHMPRAGLLAFCGAYIHDLGRKWDGVDDMHGADAVKYHFDRFNALWDRYGLTEDERKMVKDAVTQHSTTEWMTTDDEGYDVMAILKDADALDRCRIGDLNPRWLRYQQSNALIEAIENLFENTWNVNHDMTMIEFIEASC